MNNKLFFAGLLFFSALSLSATAPTEITQEQQAQESTAKIMFNFPDPKTEAGLKLIAEIDALMAQESPAAYEEVAQKIKDLDDTIKRGCDLPCEELISICLSLIANNLTKNLHVDSQIKSLAETLVCCAPETIDTALAGLLSFVAGERYPEFSCGFPQALMTGRSGERLKKTISYLVQHGGGYATFLCTDGIEQIFNLKNLFRPVMPHGFICNWNSSVQAIVNNGATTMSTENFEDLLSQAGRINSYIISRLSTVANNIFERVKKEGEGAIVFKQENWNQWSTEMQEIRTAPYSSPQFFTKVLTTDAALHLLHALHTLQTGFDSLCSTHQIDQDDALLLKKKLGAITTKCKAFYDAEVLALPDIIAPLIKSKMLTESYANRTLSRCTYWGTYYAQELVQSL